MALTIGRRWPTSAPRGDYAAICDVCQVRYRRSQLVRRADGLLVCCGPGTLDDAAGRDASTLDRLNSEHARHAGRQRHRHQGGHLDQLPPLLVQSLEAPPVAFWTCGERVSRTHAGSILQLGLLDPNNEVPSIDADGVDVGYTEGTNVVATTEERTACGSSIGYGKKLYDQVGAFDIGQTSTSVALHPQAWKKTVQQYIGVGALPLLYFSGLSVLSRTDACGLSGDAAATLFVVCSGLGTALHLGGSATLDQFGIELSDEDPADAYGEVGLNYGGFSASYRVPRWRTMAERETELYVILARRAAGAALDAAEVLLDGQLLDASALTEEVPGPLAITNTATMLGALTGHVYAAGVWDVAVSDEDAGTLYAWARRAIAKMNDHRGALVGSAQP